MFNTPPPPSRHLTTTVRTRSAWKKEEMMKEELARDVQSEILKKGNPETAFSVDTRPKTDGVCLKSVHSLHPVFSKQHSSSPTSKSIEARKKQLEFEAAKEMAEIERKAIEKNAQLEKSLIEQKLAAEIAALESASKSRRSSLYQPTEIDSIGKVQQWLDKSHLAENLKNNDSHVDRDGGHSAAGGSGGGGGAGGASGAEMQNLVSAIHQSNLQNKQLISRFATSKDLPQFYGDPLEWLAYKQAYDESTKICKYSDAENMWRLRKSLKGEAKETVSSLLIGTTAPQTIIEALELRYGRPETIIHKITYQLKKIPPLSQNYHHEIVSFSIKIKNFVAAAKAVKQTDYLRSPELVSSVLTKCPSALINKWADYYSLNCKIEKAKLEVLAEFLYSEANKISAAGLTHLQSQSDYRKKPEERRTHSVLLSAKRSYASSCKFCKVSSHKLPECARFKRALTKDRWRFVRVNNLCHKCLLGTHSRDTCSAASCSVDECGLPHHRFLHWKLKASANSAKSENSEKTESDKILTNNDNSKLTSDKTIDQVKNSDCLVNNETVAHAMNDSKSCVFLKVVPVNIHGPKGVIRTHALLDDGATVSLISADIANSVDLHGQKQTLCVRGAWDSELMCDSENIKCKITNVNNDSFELSARKINELNLPLQKLSNIKINDYVHLNHLNNYIMCSENVKPKLLIGQDNYHLIAPIKTIMRSKNDPCATLTPLGWCVHGVCPSKRKSLTTTNECAMITVRSRCLPRHACPRAPANTPPLAAAHTGACGTTADASSDHTLTQVNTNECIYCYRQFDMIHTDSENDERLHELVRKSFIFENTDVHNKPRQNNDEIKAIEIVEKSAKLINGKWKVGLPWKDENARMASSYSNAHRRLKTIERKMTTGQEFAVRYKENMKRNLFVNDYACKIESSEKDLMTCEQRPTKRELLRIVMSIFDIYGLLTPFTIKAKIIIQNTWKSTIKWDEQIPTKQFEIFREWISQLHEIKDIRIPRWYLGGHSPHQTRTSPAPPHLGCSSSSATIELHVFCDASPAAYAAVAHWRVHTDNTNVCVSFIASKSRVAPIKPSSIPRLELQDAVLACRFADVIQKEHRLQPNKRYFWTDSTTLLHWIALHWIATKNIYFKMHKDCEWFQGPGFLYEKDSSWMTTAPVKEKVKINEENLEIIHHVHVTEYENLPIPDPEKFSSCLRLLKSTPTVLLFFEKCKKTCKKEIDTELIQRAERLLTRYAQMQSFSTEISLLKNNKQIQPDNRVRTLTPYLDEWGLLRVGGRVEAATDVSSDNQRPHPHCGNKEQVWSVDQIRYSLGTTSGC